MEVPPWGQELGLAARVCGPGSCPGQGPVSRPVSCCGLLEFLILSEHRALPFHSASISVQFARRLGCDTASDIWTLGFQEDRTAVH